MSSMAFRYGMWQGSPSRLVVVAVEPPSWTSWRSDDLPPWEGSPLNGSHEASRKDSDLRE